MISPYPHLIDLNDYPVSWWKQVVDLGEQIKNHPEIYAGACSNKIPYPDVVPDCNAASGRQTDRFR